MLSILALPKDVLRHILNFLDPHSWLQCLKAHRIFHVLLKEQADRHYEKILVEKKIKEWRRKFDPPHIHLRMYQWNGFSCFVTWTVSFPEAKKSKGFCNHCGKILRKDVLLKHAEKCSRPAEHSCKICHKWTRSCAPWELYRHEQICKNVKWTCRHCQLPISARLRKGHLLNDCKKIPRPYLSSLCSRYQKPPVYDHHQVEAEFYLS